MDELIKAVPKPLYFFLIQNCCIIEALMMVILIDAKKNNAITDGCVAPLTMLLTIVIMYHKILSF